MKLLEIIQQCKSAVRQKNQTPLFQNRLISLIFLREVNPLNLKSFLQINNSVFSLTFRRTNDGSQVYHAIFC